MTTSTQTKRQQMKELKTELEKLKLELSEVNKAAGIDEYISVKVRKNQAHYERKRDPLKTDIGIGTYQLTLDITAKTENVFIPISIASGKKVTGFIYQIEGTAEGSIGGTDITCSGEGVTQITLGTLRYAKIPPATTATFKIIFTIKGKLNKKYSATIHRINYKLSATDPRYKQYVKEIKTDTLKFS